MDAAFQEAGGHRVRRTSGPGDARRIARELAAEGEERIVAAGGDGTLSEVVQGLRDADALGRVVVGLVPLGTGNDLARSLGLSDDPPTAIQVALGPGGGPDTRVISLDLLRVRLDEGDPVWALNAVVVGQGGAIGDALSDDDKARWGPLSYLRGAAEVVRELRAMRMAVMLPERGVREAAILNVVAANGRFAGGGVPIAPGARPDDGEIDVVTLDDMPLSRLVGLLPSLFLGAEGSVPDDPAWRQSRHTRVEVAAVGGGSDLPVSIDGENTTAARVEVEVEAGAVQMVVPAPDS